MKRLARLFSKSPSDLLSRGDRHLASGCFFEARTCYEDGLQRCSDDQSAGTLKSALKERITTANSKLAERNLHEAEFALERDDTSKAFDHLELVKTLTCDASLLEKAEKLLYQCSSRGDDHSEPTSKTSPSCSSCSQGADVGDDETAPFNESLPPLEYYDLLIRQLPEDQYHRYSGLGENFAFAYLAASHDRHEDALSGFELCSGEIPQDIYWYEKGKVLHRLGRESEAEQSLRTATQINRLNALAWLNLALLLHGSNRVQETLHVLNTMVSEGLLPEQAMLIRAEVYEALGDIEGAINQYIELLSTPCMRSAAEKLHGLLIENGRESDAAVIYKKYLGKCCH